jgi:hypothetical protein
MFMDDCMGFLHMSKIMRRADDGRYVGRNSVTLELAVLRTTVNLITTSKFFQICCHKRRQLSSSRSAISRSVYSGNEDSKTVLSTNDNTPHTVAVSLATLNVTCRLRQYVKQQQQIFFSSLFPSARLTSGRYSSKNICSIFHYIPRIFIVYRLFVQTHTHTHTYIHIQGDSGGICEPLGNDSMRDSKQKSTYIYTGWSKRLCAPDDYSTKNTQKYFIPFQSLTMITYLELGITSGVSVSLVARRPWRSAAKQSDWAN